MESIDNFFHQPSSTGSPSNSHDTFDVSCFFASSDSNHHGLQSEPSPSIHSSEYSNFQKPLPFTIIRDNDQSVKPRASVVQKKVIEKKNKGGKRKLPNQQELKSILSQAKKHYIPEGIDNTNLSDSARRKMIQAVKNRIAAQRTRDRRKAQFSELQETQNRLAQTNEELNSKYSELERKFRLLEEANRKLAAENEELRKRSVVNSAPIPARQEIMIENDLFIDPEIEFESLLRQKNNGLSLSRTSSTKSDWMQLFTSFAIIIAVYSGSHIKVGNVVTVDKGTEGKTDSAQSGSKSEGNVPGGSGPEMDAQPGEPDTGDTEIGFSKERTRGKEGETFGGGPEKAELVKNTKSIPGNSGDETEFSTFNAPSNDPESTSNENFGASSTGPADEADGSNSFGTFSADPEDGPVDTDTYTDPENEGEKTGPSDVPHFKGNARPNTSNPPPMPIPDTTSGEPENTQSIPAAQSPENFSWNFDYVCIAIFLFSILCLIGFKYMKRVLNWFGNRSYAQVREREQEQAEKAV